MTALAHMPRRNALSAFMALASGALVGSFLVVSAPSRPPPWISGLVIVATALVVLAAWAALAVLLVRQGKSNGRDPGLRSAAACLLGSLLLAAYAPIYWLAGDHPALALWVRWYVLGTGVLLVASAHIVLLGAWPARHWPLERTGRRHAGSALVAMIIIYIVSCIAANAYRWRIFALGNVDSAIIIQSLRNTLEGTQPFFNTIEKA